MTNLDSLVVEIKADLTDIRKGMKNAVKVTQQSTKKITESNKLLAGGFNKVRIMAIAAAAGIIYMGKQTLNEVDRIQKLGKKLDTTTEFLSRMKFVAEQSGLAFEGLATGFTMMQRNIGDAAEGVGEAKQAFESLGISAEKLLQLSLEDQFMMIATELANTKNATTRTQIAMDIFGRSGSSLNQILKDGIVNMKNIAKATPNVITQKDADRIATFNDNMNILKRNIQGAMIPLLGTMTKKINDLFTASDKLTTRNMKQEIDNTKIKIEVLENTLKKLKSQNKETSDSVFIFTSAIKDSFTALNGGKPKQEKYISDIKRTEDALRRANLELIEQQNLLQKPTNKDKNIITSSVNIDSATVQNTVDEIKKTEAVAVKSSNVIKDAMIEGTDQWSSRLTDAIIDGGNMFESLAEIAKRTAIQTAIVNPFIGAIQGGITGLMTPNTPTPIKVGSNMGSGGSTININNNNTFTTDMAASVRAEIITYAPELQAATIQGVQSAINDGKLRT